MRPLLRIVTALLVAAAGLAISAGPAGAAEVTITYSVGSEGSVRTDVGAFAEVVRSTLDNPDGWSLGGSIDWVPVREGADVRIVIASPEEIGALTGCSHQYSCHVSGTVYINDDRWNEGAAGWSRSLHAYRHYVINHEVGHYLELEHADCPSAGAPAPVMMQQTIETDPCVNRVWPLRYERELVADRYGVEVREASEASLRWVQRAYERLLGRAAEPGAAEALAQRLDAEATTRGHAVDDIMGSFEFDAVTASVGRLYFAAFLRAPEPGGLLHWTEQVQAGHSLVTVAEQFASSAELRARYGDLDDAELVDRLYRNVLGRPAEEDGQRYWTSKLQAGELTRGGVLHHFAQSAEHRARRATRVTVTLAYALLLDRVGPREDVDEWVRELDSGSADRIDLVQVFLAQDGSVL